MYTCMYTTDFYMTLYNNCAKLLVFLTVCISHSYQSSPLLSSLPPQGGEARVVGGTCTSYGHSSFGIDPHNYTRMSKEHRDPRSSRGASGTRSPESSLATVSHATSHLSQASIHVAAADDDTLTAREEGECRDKLLLTTNSIGMSETGRPVYRMSMSEGGVVGMSRQVSTTSLCACICTYMTCTLISDVSVYRCACAFC